ncbi:MAG: hypothetical protein WCF65_00505 [Parachlamydiaceae bacterium]
MDIEAIRAQDRKKALKVLEAMAFAQLHENTSEASTVQSEGKTVGEITGRHVTHLQDSPVAIAQNPLKINNFVLTQFANNSQNNPIKVARI